MQLFTISIRGNIPKLYVIKIAKWFMLTMPILMLFYKDMGFTNEEAFRLKALYSIVIVIFEIPSGYFADILGRKTTLILGAILGTLGFLFYSIGHSFLYFALAEITLGLGQSFISGSDSALLYDSLKENNQQHDYTKFEGFITSIGNYAESLGAIIGGALAEISLRTPFFWQTGIAFLAIPAALTLVEPKRAKTEHNPGFMHILKIVKYSLITNIKLRWALIYSSLIGSATLTMAWVYQLQLKELGFGEFQIGSTATFLNLLVGTVTLVAYKIEKRTSTRFLMLFITVVITTGFVAAGLSKTPWVLLTVLTIFYAVRGIATPVLKNIVNIMAASEARATILSIRSLIIRAFFAIIAPLFGWISDRLSLNEALIIIGIVFIILSLSIVSLFIKNITE